MVDWMQQVDAHRSDLRELHDEQFARLSAMVAEQVSVLRQEMSAQRTEFRHDLNLGLSHLETKLEQRAADLMKWSFVFWVGAVGAIALLAGVLK